MPVNVTLFGNRVSADDRVKVGPDPIRLCPHKWAELDTGTDTYGGKTM